MHFLNRTAVVVVPKQRYLDWLHAADPAASRISMGQIQQDPPVYLLPECNNDAEAEVHLRKVCKEIFAHELDAWHRDSETWPRDLGFAEFRKRFDYSFHSVVIDLCRRPLSTEEF